MFGILASLVTPLALAASPGPWPDLATPTPAQGVGRQDAALIVAVSDYAQLDAIPGATENAELWYQWLIGSRGVAPEHVHRLYDGEAVKESIQEDLLQAANEVGTKGTLWVLFITHGAPATDGKDVVLVGADALPTARSLYARSISRSEVLSATAGAAQAVVVLDSCFSGKGYSGAKLVKDALAPVIPVDAMRKVSTAPSTAVALAAGADEFAGPLPGAGRPAFSYLLLGALEGWGDRNADRRVTPSEAVAWTNGALSMTVQGRRQSPSVQVTGVEMALPSVRKALTNADLLAIAENVREAPVVAVGSTLQMGDTDLVKKTRELQEQQRLREEAERREVELRAALEAAEKAQVQNATAALQASAHSEWIGAASLTAGTTPEARDFANAFLEKYQDAAVVVNGTTHGVALPELKEARAVVARVDAAEAAGAFGTSSGRDSGTNAHAERGGRGRTALWVVDTLLAGAGVAGLVSGQVQAKALERDIADGIVQQWDRASERQTLANVTTGLGYAGLASGVGLGIGLMVSHPVDTGWVIGVGGRF